MNQSDGLRHAARSLDDTIGFLDVAANQIGPISRVRTEQIRQLAELARALQERILQTVWGG